MSIPPLERRPGFPASNTAPNLEVKWIGTAPANGSTGGITASATDLEELRRSTQHSLSSALASGEIAPPQLIKLAEFAALLAAHTFYSPSRLRVFRDLQSVPYLHPRGSLPTGPTAMFELGRQSDELHGMIKPWAQIWSPLSNLKPPTHFTLWFDDRDKAAQLLPLCDEILSALHCNGTAIELAPGEIEKRVDETVHEASIALPADCFVKAATNPSRLGHPRVIYWSSAALGAFLGLTGSEAANMNWVASLGITAAASGMGAASIALFPKALLERFSDSAGDGETETRRV